MSVILAPRAAHQGEGFVARRVEEGDLAGLCLDLIRADVLRDAAGLSFGDLGGADGVEQGRLSVVHVTHHGHHGRSGNTIPDPSLSSRPRWTVGAGVGRGLALGFLLEGG